MELPVLGKVAPEKSDSFKVKQQADAQEKADVLAQIGVYLADYDNLESNIPINHEYWELLTRYRAL
jgi:hypothetical protein